MRTRRGAAGREDRGVVFVRPRGWQAARERGSSQCWAAASWTCGAWLRGPVLWASHAAPWPLCALRSAVGAGGPRRHVPCRPMAPARPFYRSVG